MISALIGTLLLSEVSNATSVIVPPKCTPTGSPVSILYRGREQQYEQVVTQLLSATKFHTLRSGQNTVIVYQEEKIICFEYVYEEYKSCARKKHLRVHKK